MANQAEIVYQNGLAIALSLSAFRDSEEVIDTVIFDSDTYEGCWNPAVLPEGWNYSSQLRATCGQFVSDVSSYFSQYIGTSQIFYGLQTNASSWQPPLFSIDGSLNTIRKRQDSSGVSGFLICFPIKRVPGVRSLEVTFKMSNYYSSYDYGCIKLLKIENGSLVEVFSSPSMTNTAFQTREFELTNTSDVDYIAFYGYDRVQHWKYLKLKR